MDAEQLLEHRTWVRSLAHSLVFDSGRVDDVVQEAWLQALRRPPGHSGNVRGWLYSVVRNVARQMGRSETTRLRHEARASEGQSQRFDDFSPDALFEKASREQQLVDHVMELPEPYRQAILLRYFEDMSPAEIARRLEIPVATVATRLRRALDRLRAVLDRDFGDRRTWSLSVLPMASLAEHSAKLTPLAALGGAVMKIQTQVAIVVLVLAGGLMWMWSPEASTADPSNATAAGSSRTKATTPETDDASSTIGLPLAVDDAQIAAIPDPVDLEARDRDRDLFGIVRSESGAPIAGASITTQSQVWGQVFLGGPDGHEIPTVPGARGTSAADGSFSLRLRRSAIVDLTVTADGYAQTTIAKCNAGERVDIVLGLPAPLSVTVVDSEGEPVSGVRIKLTVLSDDDRIHRARRPTASRIGRTSDSGAASFNDLFAGSGELRADHPDYASSPILTVELTTGESTSAQVVLERGRVVSGFVTDRASGEPLVDVRVGVGWWVGDSVVTDRVGRYELRGMSHRALRLTATAEGFGLATMVVASEQSTADFALSPGDAAVGRVVGSGGEPVVGALVSAVASVHEGGVSKSDSRSTTSEDQGYFELGSLRTDLPHTLVVQAEGYGRTLIDFDHTTGEGGLVDLGEITIGDALCLEGRVVDQHDRPFAGAQIIIVGSNSDRDDCDPALRVRWRHGWGPVNLAFPTTSVAFVFPTCRPAPTRSSFSPRTKTAPSPSRSCSMDTPRNYSSRFHVAGPSP